MQVYKIIKENQPLFFLYLISTVYFLYQYHTSTLWDFSAYILNARYLFYGGTYFEVYRAPLAPILLGIFLLIGKIGIYLYIWAISTFFLYSTIKISSEIFKDLEEKKKKIAKIIFYFFSLSPFVLLYGLGGGTELLGFALLEMFIYSLIAGKISGVWLGLAILTRYNFLYFIPLLLMHKRAKEIIKNLLITIAIIFPWLLFNYIRYGNWFTSIIDSYALNIHFRQYLTEQISFSQLLPPIGWFWPFLIIGIVISITQLIKRPIKENKTNIIIFLLVAIIIYDFYNTPFKITRYLFNLALPIAFFSARGALLCIEKLKLNKKVIISFILIIFIVTSGFLFFHRYQERWHKQQFVEATKDIHTLNLSHCEILSPHWVLVAYYTGNVYPLNWNYINQEIFDNKTILIFKDEYSRDYPLKETPNDFPLLYETEKYIFWAKPNISKICSPSYISDKPLVSEPCQIIYEKFGKNLIGKFALKSCNLVN